MGEISVYTDKIKKHFENNKLFYKNNQDVIIVLGVMTLGYFISKMWRIKHGNLMFITTLFIIVIAMKTTKKKSNTKPPTTKKTKETEETQE